MVTSAANPADIVNLALGRIGYRLRVGSLLDGSEAASRALDIFGQTRDELLRDGNWGFAEGNALLTQLKAAPSGGYIPPVFWDTTYPPLPWQYSYAYPDDCLKVRAVKVAPLFLFNPDPTPSLWDIANDTVTSATDYALASLALDSPGTGTYAAGDTITLEGGVQVRLAQLLVVTSKVVSATIAAAGTGGTPGTQTVTGTTGTGTKFQASVTVSGGGVITAILSVTVAGSYTVNPTAPTLEPVTGASLSGAKLNVKLGVATFSIAIPGVFTTQSTTFTQAGTTGTGTGATFQTATYSALSEKVRVILANIDNAVCVYTRQVTDPSSWDVGFTEALAAQLAQRLAPVLTSLNVEQIAAKEAAQMTAMAMQEQG